MLRVWVQKLVNLSKTTQSQIIAAEAIIQEYQRRMNKQMKYNIIG